jgi:hypothetical protein
MKALLVLLVVMATAFSAPKDFKEYAPVAEKIENKYIKIQTDYAKLNARYRYEFYPITMFPSFCMVPDSLLQFLHSCPIVYVADVTIGVYKRQGEQHVLMVVKNYLAHKTKPSEFMTYTLFFMKQDPASKEWIEEKESVFVTLVLLDPKKEEYECKPKK